MPKLIIITSPSDFGYSVLKSINKSESDIEVLDCIGLPVFNHFNYTFFTFLKWVIFKKKTSGFKFIKGVPLFRRVEARKDYFVPLKSKVEQRIISGKTFSQTDSVRLTYYERLIIDRVYNYLEEIIPRYQEVICFNGRSLVLKIARDVCQKSAVKFIMNELWSSPDGSIRFKEIYSTYFFDEEAEEVARMELLSEDKERVQIYLEKRFEGSDELLKYWNTLGKANRVKDVSLEEFDVLFCFSSEDEYFGKWSHQGVLDMCYNQVDIVKDLFVRYGESYKTKKFVFKLHPRINDRFLKKTKQRYVNLQNFLVNAGFQVDFISTEVDVYSLIKRSKLVIGFGSPVIEAVYYNKPAVLLGPTLFMRTESIYCANSLGEINNFILNIPKPLSKVGVFQYFNYLISHGKEIEKI